MENTRENTPFRKLRLVLFYPGSDTGFTQSLKKQTTEKILLHSQCFSNQATVCQQHLAGTLGKWFSHDPEFREEKGYLSYTLPSSLWGLQIMCQEKWRVEVTGTSLDKAVGKPFLVQIASMGVYQKHAHIPCLPMVPLHCIPPP